jgi:nicotinamide-nucleotide amidase
MRTAAVVTIGTELTTGLRQDTNGGAIARALRDAGYHVESITALPDDAAAVSLVLSALMARCALVVVTGGLGPTHDDITREAAAHALGRPLVRDAGIAARLEDLARRHSAPEARERMLRQADVIEGARVIAATSGSAPGQMIAAGRGRLVLLPGPPAEMHPMLDEVLTSESAFAPPVRFRCTGISESDAQARVEPALADHPDVTLTLLAAPGEVEVVLFAPDAPASLQRARQAVRAALGIACFSEDGSSLPETVIGLARRRGDRLALAESCTGGMASASLTEVPGASEVFLGGVVSYADAFKSALLGVDATILAAHGAVSEAAARAMAEGALRLPGATLAASVTGIAGPGGGTADKPVGLVWFAVAAAGGPTVAAERLLLGDRAAIRTRAAATLLDLLRLRMEGD